MLRAAPLLNAQGPGDPLQQVPPDPQGGTAASNAGEVTDFTVGLNWFLNPNAKVQANYFVTDLDSFFAPNGGDFSEFGVRFAFDF